MCTGRWWRRFWRDWTEALFSARAKCSIFSTVIFSWDEWNTGHIATHGVSRAEAEHVAKYASDPFPRDVGEDKHLVWGPTEEGRLLQVIFVYRASDEIDFGSLTLEQWMAVSEGAAGDIIYIVHAMPLTTKLLRQYRRLRR